MGVIPQCVVPVCGLLQLVVARLVVAVLKSAGLDDWKRTQRRHGRSGTHAIELAGARYGVPSLGRVLGDGKRSEATR